MDLFDKYYKLEYLNREFGEHRWSEHKLFQNIGFVLGKCFRVIGFGNKTRGLLICIIITAIIFWRIT